MRLIDPYFLCLLADKNDDSLGLVLLLLIGGPLLCAVFYFARRREKKRTEQFRRSATEVGLPFFPAGDDFLFERLQCFHLFSQGRRKKITNMLHGEANGVELAILDYRYTIAGGEQSRTYKQSVIYFGSSNLGLPQFAARPERMFHKIGGAFGYQDIDFEDHPDFSRAYLLRGDDESRIREFFNSELLTFFETQQKISVEAGGDQLIFYRGGKRIKPDEVQRFIHEGFQIFGRFRDRAAASSK